MPAKMNPDVARLARARISRDKAQREWRDAIRDAHSAGLSLRVISAAAGVSHVRVLQITRSE